MVFITSRMIVKWSTFFSFAKLGDNVTVFWGCSYAGLNHIHLQIIRGTNLHCERRNKPLPPYFCGSRRHVIVKAWMLEGVTGIDP